MTNLEKYINSGGVTLPHNYAEYGPGEDRQYFCVFCNSIHESIPVYVAVGGIAALSLNTNTMCCAACGVEVMSKVIDKLEGVEAFDVSVFGHSTRMGLLQEGKFDSTSIAHYQHNLMSHYLSTRFRGRGTDGEGQYREIFNDMVYSCYACKQPVSKDTTYPVPRSSYVHYLTGGEVRICHACSHEHEERTGESLHVTLKRFNREVLCVLCERSYYIDATEFNELDEHGATNQRLCPTCVIKSTMLVETELPGIASGLRWPENICQHCRSPFRVDVTTAPNMRKAHFHPKKCCYSCMHAREQPVLSEEVSKSKVMHYYYGKNDVTLRVLDRKTRACIASVTFKKGGKDYISTLEYQIKEYRRIYGGKE